MTVKKRFEKLDYEAPAFDVFDVAVENSLLQSSSTIKGDAGTAEDDDVNDWS